MSLHAQAPDPPAHSAGDDATIREEARELLLQWCTALVELQLHQPPHATPHATLAGGILCPACARVHARSWEAVHPLLCAAQLSGEERFARAAEHAYTAGERTSLHSGAWHDDPAAKLWTGTTVFGAIALGQALLHHGELLASALAERWRERLRGAVAFLLGWEGLERANGNYRAAAAYALDLAGRALATDEYAPRAAALAAAALAATSPRSGLLTGEGEHREVGSAACDAVDVAYNVEESLPALALYALRADRAMVARVVELLRAQLPFALPDGGWDEGWCTRSYKWAYWGTRTGCGCQPAYGLLAGADPRFGAVGLANLRLLRRCTHDGLLHGGPHYAAHGIEPCVHHTVFHARALATLLDEPPVSPAPAIDDAPGEDGRDHVWEVPGARVWIVRSGPWRATLSACDCLYYPAQPTGGALVLLWHDALGPLLAAGPLDDRAIEPHNAQVDRGQAYGERGGRAYATPTPGVELRYEGETFHSAACAQPQVTVAHTPAGCVVRASGGLLSTARRGPRGREAPCAVSYAFDGQTVTVSAAVPRELLALRPTLVLPLIAAPSARVEHERGRLTIEPPDRKARIELRADPPEALGPAARGFALVPGFGTVRAALDLVPGAGRGSLELRVAGG